MNEHAPIRRRLSANGADATLTVPSAEFLTGERRHCRLVAIGSAADYLSVSRATVERLVFRGELHIVKVGGSTRYDVDDLDNYIEVNRHRNRRRSA
jgi:excisionase family DNA binding protein